MKVYGVTTQNVPRMSGVVELSGDYMGKCDQNGYIYGVVWFACFTA